MTIKITPAAYAAADALIAFWEGVKKEGSCSTQMVLRDRAKYLRTKKGARYHAEAAALEARAADMQ